MAYFADDRQDLLNGINEFLDCSIVIPPSDVEGKDLLKTVASFQKMMLRKRRERENKKCLSVTVGVDQETKGARRSLEQTLKVSSGASKIAATFQLP